MVPGPILSYCASAIPRTGPGASPLQCESTNGVPKWNRTIFVFSDFREFREPEKSQFKDPVSDICLPGAVVESWSLTQEVAGSSPFTVMRNIFVTEYIPDKLVELNEFNNILKWENSTKSHNHKRMV